jgi:hypothetical protein
MTNTPTDTLARLRAALEKDPIRPGSEWGDDDGCVLWFDLPIEEPPYCGEPGDEYFPWVTTPIEDLHWCPLPEAVFMFAGDPLRNAAPALLDVVESALRLTLADGLQQICGQPVAKQALRRLQDALARLGEAT